MEYDIPFFAERKAALIEEINAAFDGVSREGGVSMSEAEVIDDYGSDEERAQARARDTESRWQDISDEQLALNWPISFFDPIGFRYYMPAYLTYYLRWMNVDEDEWDDSAFHGNGSDSLFYHLSAGHLKGEIEDHFLLKFEIFTPAQGRAIAHFLELEGEYTDACIAEIAQLDAERKDDEECKKWREHNQRRETEKKAKISPEKLKDLEERDREHQIYCAQFDWPDNDARYALEKYWGRFL